MAKVARIDKKLNLVVPIYGEPVQRVDTSGNPVLDPETKRQIIDEPVIAYAHSTPITRDLFERYFMVVAQSWALMMGGGRDVPGLGITAGPSCASLVLRHVAQRNNAWEDDPATGTPGVRMGLVEELKRLTTVIVLADDGWKPVPLAIAAAQGFINEEDAMEVENAVVFFIVASAMLNRAARGPMVEAAASLWGASTSSLTSMELTTSLRTSTGIGNFGEKSPAPVSGEQTAAPATEAVKQSSVPV